MNSKLRAAGFSLVEVLMAMLILSVGLLAVIGMIVSASMTANSTKVDTTATMLADTVLEQLAAKDVTNVTTFTIKDCLGVDHTIGHVSGAAPNGNGSTLNGNKDIDFTAGKVANYQMDFVTCGAAGVRNTFDVRWNVMDMNGALPGLAGNYSKLITVSARQNTKVGIYSAPVTLRTVEGTL
jgi:prepilin-type N-terminal cleavage/methylation domain-containing protein